MIDIQVNKFAINVIGQRYRVFPRRMSAIPDVVTFLLVETRKEFMLEVDRRCRVETWGWYDAGAWFEALVKRTHSDRLADLEAHLRNHLFHMAAEDCRADEIEVCDRFADMVAEYRSIIKGLEPKKSRIPTPVLNNQLSLF